MQHQITVCNINITIHIFLTYIKTDSDNNYSEDGFAREAEYGMLNIIWLYLLKLTW